MLIGFSLCYEQVSDSLVHPSHKYRQILQPNGVRNLKSTSSRLCAATNPCSNKYPDLQTQHILFL